VYLAEFVDGAHFCFSCHSVGEADVLCDFVHGEAVDHVEGQYFLFEVVEFVDEVVECDV